IEAARSASKARTAELEAEVRRLRGELDDERSRRRAASAADARVDATAVRRIAELEAAVAEARREADRTATEVDRLIGVERELRRERSTLEAALIEATTGPGWLGADPAVLAGHLDELARMARVAQVGAAEPVEPGRSPLRLPQGARPDRHEAIDWLVEQRTPLTLVVDGYNAGFHLTGSREPAAARRRLGLEIGRLSPIAAGPMRIVIVYDSSVGAAPPVPGAAGPEVRFTDPGTPADEEIARLAATLSGPVIVLSSDRWVREATEAAGALALWSEALVDWTGKR
ncbi:MAG TPA: NYN domain-containing protein, partial [Acidimicrobiia bacterium]|nr:NYN domain-containing protein [Acidimicrobiia bacterium]